VLLTLIMEAVLYTVEEVAVEEDRETTMVVTAVHGVVMSYQVQLIKESLMLMALMVAMEHPVNLDVATAVEEPEDGMVPRQEVVMVVCQEEVQVEEAVQMLTLATKVVVVLGDVEKSVSGVGR